jgi:hypothetical protein
LPSRSTIEKCVVQLGASARRSGGAKILLQHREGVRHGRAGGQLGRRENRPAAIGDFQRLAHMRAERGEIARLKGSTGLANVGGDGLREIALVEIACAARGKLRECHLEPVLWQAHRRADAPLRIRRQAVLEIGSRARRVTPQICGRTGNHQRGPPIHQ